VFALDCEPQRVGGISVLSEPPSISRIRLDIVRERHAQLNFGFSQLFEFRTRPGELVEIHVSRLDAALFLPEGLEFVFRNEGKVVGRA